MNVNTLRFDHYTPSKNAYLVKHNGNLLNIFFTKSEFFSK